MKKNLTPAEEVKIEIEIEREKEGILLDRKITDMQKSQFVKEIKGGLGEKIKENKNKIKEVNAEKSKLSKFFKKLFSIF